MSYSKKNKRCIEPKILGYGIVCVLFIVFLMLFSNFSLLAKSVEKRQVKAKTKIPEPMTLKAALNLSRLSTPVINQAQAELEIAIAQQAYNLSEYGTKLGIEAEARWIEPAESSINQDSNDSRVSIVVRKKLYDFGRKSIQQQSDNAVAKSKGYSLLNQKAKLEVAVMAAFYNVILADLKYVTDNEAMAVAYIRFDRLRAKNKLGQISELELLESESRYHQVRTRRYQSDVNRRLMREKFAAVINQPGQLSKNFSYPALKGNKRKLPAISVLTKQVLLRNNSIKVYEEELDVAQLNIQLAKKENGASISVEAKAYEYERVIGSRDKARAGLILTVPLWTGGTRKAAVAKASAYYSQAKARLNNVKLKFRIAVIEIRQSIYVLNAKVQEMNVMVDVRDLSLDRNRALYQMDVKSDLGDGMVRQSEAKYLKAKVDFELSLAWAKLDALISPKYAEEKIF